MKQSQDQINTLLNLIETIKACEIEVKNIDFGAMEELKYKNPINLN